MSCEAISTERPTPAKSLCYLHALCKMVSFACIIRLYFLHILDELLTVQLAKHFSQLGQPPSDHTTAYGLCSVASIQSLSIARIRVLLDVG